MLADYHTHTPLCHHATGTPEEYVESAIASDLKEFGLSDHAPTATEPFDDWRMSQKDLPAYYDLIDRAKDHAGEQIQVRAGLECDWLPGCEKWIETLLHAYEWDYLIGSVHYIGDTWDFDNPKWLGKWAETDVDQAWELYWKTYTAMADSALFDILGHPDLIKKFGYFPEGNLTRFYDPAIDAIASSGSAIELNTAGFYKNCKEQYPSVEFLELANAAGIPIVISSDAHAPNEVGRDFDKAISLIKEAGYSEVCFFEKQQKSVLAF